MKSLRIFLDAKYAPPFPLWVEKGEEKEENLFKLLTFFATNTDAKRAANAIPKIKMKMKMKTIIKEN